MDAALIDRLRAEAHDIMPSYAAFPRWDTDEEQRFLLLELAARAGCLDAVSYLGKLIPRSGHGHHVISEARKSIPKPYSARGIPLDQQLVIVKELALISGTYRVLPVEALDA